MERHISVFTRIGANPRAILLDLAMPEMDSWQFRASQKKDPELAEIPVIVVSAFNNVAIDVDEILDMLAGRVVGYPARPTINTHSNDR